jgi:hypothetical protein
MKLNRSALRRMILNEIFGFGKKNKKEKSEEREENKLTLYIPPSAFANGLLKKEYKINADNLLIKKLPVITKSMKGYNPGIESFLFNGNLDIDKLDSEFLIGFYNNQDNVYDLWNLESSKVGMFSSDKFKIVEYGDTFKKVLPVIRANRGWFFKLLKKI